MTKYSLLIHGQYSENCLDNIKSAVLKFEHGFSKIILVSYEQDYDNYCNLIKQLYFENIEIVTIKDLINPGFFNINRQILSVNAGLRLIDDDDYVFKLRNDQIVDFNKVARYFDDDKIITTNCYTRKDRLYHPSDMFLAAKSKQLKEYYSLPISDKTHLMVEMDNILYYKNNPQCKAVRYCPETMLARHYLELRGWDFKETPDDSYNALGKYFKILNSWNIDFRSYKIRSYNEKQNSIVIPHYFKVSPFAGMQSENVSCYLQHDFENKLPSCIDIIYLIKAKIYWYFWPKNKKYYKYKFKKLKLISIKIICEILKILPYMFVHKRIEKLQSKIGSMQ